MRNDLINHEILVQVKCMSKQNTHAKYVAFCGSYILKICNIEWKYNNI